MSITRAGLMAAMALTFMSWGLATDAAQAADGPSAFTLSVVRDAAPDPVNALPAQLAVASKADSWNAQVLKRVTELMKPATKDDDWLAASARLFHVKVRWQPAASLASFNLPEEARAWAVEPPENQSLDQVCRRARAESGSNCDSALADLMGAAAAAHVAGDVAKAEQYYQQVLTDDAVVTAWMTDGRNCYRDLERFRHIVRIDCVSALESRALYEGLSGRPDALVHTLLVAENLPDRPFRDPIEFPSFDLAPDLMQQLLLRGQLRNLGQLADLIIKAYPKLGYLQIIGSLMTAIDVQTWSGKGLANALNLLAIAAQPTYFGAFTPSGKDVLELALDCRAAAIRAQTPDTRSEALARFDDLLTRYRNLGESNFTGYCMYRLAGAIGRADAQPAVMEVMRSAQRKAADENERSARAWLKDQREYVDYLNTHFRETAAQKDDKARYPNAEAAFIDSMRRRAGPWTLFVLDENEYRNVLSGILDLSKGAPASARNSLFFAPMLNILLLTEEYRVN